MRTSLSEIRAHSPCRDGWEKLLRHLGKTEADDEPLSIETILDSNGIADALWCLRAVEGHDREMRLYAVWCARRVKNLMSDPSSVAALDVAELHARGRATDEELRLAARAAAEAAAWAWAWAAAEAAAEAWAAAWLEAWAGAAAAAAWVEAAASGAARENETTAQAEELLRICREIDAGRDPYPEEKKQ